MVKMMNKNHPISTLEKTALTTAIVKIEDQALRDALMTQIEHLCAKSRTPKTTGYYVDFIDQEHNKARPVNNNEKLIFHAEATHPDGKNAIFFDVYVENLLISFMELSSTSTWPNDENSIMDFR